jgi:hypothetical protein
MPILVDHSYTLWSLAWDARNRAVNIAVKHSTDFASDATVAIILAAASTEGFINELADAVRLQLERPDFYSVSPQLSAFADAHDQLEDRRGSTGEKYIVAAEKLSGTPFDKGSKPYQPFATLMRLRDRHMHLRSRDNDGIIDNGPRKEPTITISRPKGDIAFIQCLMQAGLTWKGDNPEIGISWLNLLQTARMAEWACKAALDIIRAVLAMIPDGLADPASIFRHDFLGRTDYWIRDSPPLP